MAKQTPIEKLDAEIKAILESYAGEISQKTDEILKNVVRVGTNDLKANSRRAMKSKRRKYANGWKYAIRNQRMYSVGVIYNTHPNIPHLVEKSHVIRNGTGRTYGTTTAVPHIKEIEEKIVQEYTQKIKEMI